MKETVEVLDAAGDLGAVIVRHLKAKKGSGLGFSDAGAIALELATNPELKAALQRAADGIQNVPAEIKNIDALGGLGLAEVGIRNAKKIVEALAAA